MFKKKEGYVTKANRRLNSSQMVESYKTLIEGLNDYQNKINRALCPYPTADAALWVVTLRTLTESIYQNNPQCHRLVEEINKAFSIPQMDHKEKVKPTKER